MAAILDRRAVSPSRRDAQEPAQKKRPMPKRPGVYIAFGEGTAERGRKVLDLAEEKVIPRRSTPPPGPDEKEDDRITLNPAPDDLRAVHFEKLLAATSNENVSENDDLPTYQTTGLKRNTPAVEKKLLFDDNEIARETHSFAPPPLPSAIVEEQMATEVSEKVTSDGKVVSITVAQNWKKTKPGITPTKKGWELEEMFKEALISS